MAKNSYKVLGVPKNATDADVRRTYRKLALEHHPDRNAGSERAASRFREVTSARDILLDPVRRADLDRSLAAKRARLDRRDATATRDPSNDFMNTIRETARRQDEERRNRAAALQERLRAAQEALRQRREATNGLADRLRAARTASSSLSPNIIETPSMPPSFTELAAKLTEGRPDREAWIALGVAVDLYRIFR